jgi:hypothetical protein
VVLRVPDSFQSAHEGAYMRNLGSALILVLSLAAVTGFGARAETFDFSGTVITYTIPATGVYEIVAAGAQGGASNSGTPGGLGAVMSGDVFLTAGTVLNIVVGGSPLPLLAHSGLSDGGGGGGGGSFVFEPFAFISLIVAGGGGGAAESLVVGGPGQSGTNGEDASGGGAGGISGSGGEAGTYAGGGAGARRIRLVWQRRQCLLRGSFWRQWRPRSADFRGRRGSLRRGWIRRRWRRRI